MSAEEKSSKYMNIIKKYWSDPVWSKVISAIIIGIGTTILTGIYILIKSIYEKVAFKSVAGEVINYFKSNTEINILMLWISLIIIFCSIFIFSKAVIKKLRNKNIDE